MVWIIWCTMTCVHKCGTCRQTSLDINDWTFVLQGVCQRWTTPLPPTDVFRMLTREGGPNFGHLNLVARYFYELELHRPRFRHPAKLAAA
eukprot:1161021-Pelagomonas_calceolata.AAC.2